MPGTITLSNLFSDLAILINESRNIDRLMNIEVKGLSRSISDKVFNSKTSSHPSNWRVIKDSDELIKDPYRTSLSFSDFQVQKRYYRNSTGDIKAVTMTVASPLGEDGVYIERCILFYLEDEDVRLECTNTVVRNSEIYITDHQRWCFERLVGHSDPSLWLSFYVPKGSVYKRSKSDLAMSAHLLTIEDGNFVLADIYSGGQVTSNEEGLIDQPVVYLRVMDISQELLTFPLDAYAEKLYGLLKETGFKYRHEIIKPEVTGEVYRKLVNSPGYTNPKTECVTTYKSHSPEGKTNSSESKCLLDKFLTWLRN